MLLTFDRKTGSIASVMCIGILCVTGLLPQSNELRYFLFIPLTCAATIGMTYPRIQQKCPRLALLLLINMLVLWSYMLAENWVHYQPEKIDYRKVAGYWGTPQWWEKLQTDKVYCAVDMMPIGILLTGPTMREYRIVDRSTEALCPKGSVILSKQGIHDAQFLLNESLRLFQGGKYLESIEASKKALALKPDYAEAYNNLCVAHIKLNLKQQALAACRQAIKLNPNLTIAINNLAWAESLTTNN